MQPQTMFTNIPDALEWRENLNAEESQYLAQVDKFAATLVPGVKVELKGIVKPSNMEKFYQAFSYVLLGTGWDMSFNEDYSAIRRNGGGMKSKRIASDKLSATTKV